MLALDGPTVKKGSGEGAVQGSFEGIWGHVPPTQEETQADRRGCIIRKTGSISEGYLPKQPEKRESKMRESEGYKHGGLRRKPQETLRNGRTKIDGGNRLPDGTPKQFSRCSNHSGGDN
ncbi:hypothetical protein Tco_0765041 [Tanacetum coccineum]